MALTVTGAQLTEAHRLLQAKIGAQTVAQMIAVWRLLDPTDLDATVARWLSVVVPIVQGQRAKSAATAAAYLQAFRLIELGEPFSPVLAQPVAVPALVTSLTVTGPVSIKSAMIRGLTLTKATDLAVASVAGAAMRHSLDAGRETITATAAADPRAQGWARVTSGGACAFCDMLASRGAVYSSGSVAFASHDHCSCSGEVAYGESQSVREYVPSTRDVTDAERAGVRAWIAANPTAN